MADHSQGAEKWLVRVYVGRDGAGKKQMVSELVHDALGGVCGSALALRGAVTEAQGDPAAFGALIARADVVAGAACPKATSTV